MSVGTFAATATAQEILAASEYREEIEIQWVSGDTVFLGFGETPVVDSGIRLSSGAPYYKCVGLKARLAINMICDTGDTAAGGIDYR